MTETGPEWPYHSPLADPNIEGIADAIVSGGHDDMRTFDRTVPGITSITKPGARIRYWVVRPGSSEGIAE